MRNFEQMTAAGLQEGQSGLSLQQRITLAATPAPLSRQQLGAVETQMTAFDFWKFLAGPMGLLTVAVGIGAWIYIKGKRLDGSGLPDDPWTSPEFQAAHCAKYPQDCGR